MSAEIVHRPERHRFEAVLPAGSAHLDYRLGDGSMTILHTEVDPALGGQGLGGALVQAALAYAEAHALKVDPVCSYAAAYMERHPDTKALRA